MSMPLGRAGHMGWLWHQQSNVFSTTRSAIARKPGGPMTMVCDGVVEKFAKGMIAPVVERRQPLSLLSRFQSLRK